MAQGLLAARLEAEYIGEGKAHSLTGHMPECLRPPDLGRSGFRPLADPGVRQDDSNVRPPSRAKLLRAARKPQAQSFMLRFIVIATTIYALS